MSKELVERLREDWEMLKDGCQDNLTRAWHDVIMKTAAMDVSEAADEIERLNGIIYKISEAMNLLQDVYDGVVVIERSDDCFLDIQIVNDIEKFLALSKAHKVKE